MFAQLITRALSLRAIRSSHASCAPVEVPTVRWRDRQHPRWGQQPLRLGCRGCRWLPER